MFHIFFLVQRIRYCCKPYGDTSVCLTLLLKMAATIVTLVSPIISTRAATTSKMVETCSIPKDNFSVLDFGDKLRCIMTISTDPEVLEDPQAHPRGIANQAKSNSELLAVPHQHL